MCALGGDPWCEELRRIEVGLKIPDYLSRGNGGRLVDCKHAFNNLASIFGHDAVGGRWDGSWALCRKRVSEAVNERLHVRRADVNHAKGKMRAARSDFCHAK